MSWSRRDANEIDLTHLVARTGDRDLRAVQRRRRASDRHHDRHVTFTPEGRTVAFCGGLAGFALIGQIIVWLIG